MLQKELDQAEHWFAEELHKLKTAIFAWMQRHDALQFSVEEQQRISHVLEQLYDKTAFYEATNVLMSALNNVRADLKATMADYKKQSSKFSAISKSSNHSLQGYVQRSWQSQSEWLVQCSLDSN